MPFYVERNPETRAHQITDNCMVYPRPCAIADSNDRYRFQFFREGELGAGNAIKSYGQAPKIGDYVIYESRDYKYCVPREEFEARYKPYQCPHQ